MKVKDISAYNELKEKHKHEYEYNDIIAFTERWAELMEKGIEKGARLEEIAYDLSHKADTEGISSYMYGISVSILAECWIYGDSLRKWHNAKYNIKDDRMIADPSLVKEIIC